MRFFPFQRESAPSSAPSVWFYTFHKCASTAVSYYALCAAKNHKFVDYQALINHGTVDENSPDSVEFSDTGYLYGSIRLSAEAESPSSRKVLECGTEEFVKDRKSVFMVRDPRDVLVSEYHSFTGAHPLSEVPQIAQQQKQYRDQLSSMSLEEYVLQSADRTLDRYLRMYRLINSCNEGILLTYEQMITDYPSFIAGLTSYVDIPYLIQLKLYLVTRPRYSERPDKHKRSGKVGEHQSKLSPGTVSELNKKLGEALEAFKYPL